MRSKISGKNGKIEFLRFLFAVAIVIHHSKYVIGSKADPLIGGSLAVEFFFILSGYLMMMKIRKTEMQEAAGKDGAALSLGKETFRFIVNKAKALYPEMFVAWIIGFIVYQIADPFGGMKDTLKAFLTGFWEMFFTTMSGLGTRGINGVVWYVSSMLIAMTVMYPLIRKYKDTMIWIVIPFSAVMIYGYMFISFNSPRSGGKPWLGWTYKGNLRAWADMGMGVMAYHLAEWLKQLEFSKTGKRITAFTEWGIYILTFLYMRKNASNIDYLFILLLTVAVSLSFSGQGADDEIFNTPDVLKFGMVSMPLFLSHSFWSHNIKYFLQKALPNAGKSVWLLCYLLVAAVTTALVMFLSGRIRKAMPGIRRKIETVMLDRKKTS